MEAPENYEPHEVDLVVYIDGQNVVLGKGTTWSDADGIGITVEINPEKVPSFKKYFQNEFSIDTEI